MCLFCYQSYFEIPSLKSVSLEKLQSHLFSCTEEPISKHFVVTKAAAASRFKKKQKTKRKMKKKKGLWKNGSYQRDNRGVLAISLKKKNKEGHRWWTRRFCFTLTARGKSLMKHCSPQVSDSHHISPPTTIWSLEAAADRLNSVKRQKKKSALNVKIFIYLFIDLLPFRLPVDMWKTFIVACQDEILRLSINIT